jgi:hypothetical protein
MQAVQDLHVIYYLDDRTYLECKLLLLKEPEPKIYGSISWIWVVVSNRISEY